MVQIKHYNTHTRSRYGSRGISGQTTRMLSFSETEADKLNGMQFEQVVVDATNEKISIRRASISDIRTVKTNKTLQYSIKKEIDPGEFEMEVIDNDTILLHRKSA